MRAIVYITQQIAQAFEGIIGEHPEDWHMLQRVWLDDLDPAKGPQGDGLKDS